MAEKTYQFKMAVECFAEGEAEGEDGPKMFDANVTYYNMKYDDVVLVEKQLLGMFEGLNKFAEAKISSKKA